MDDDIDEEDQQPRNNMDNQNVDGNPADGLDNRARERVANGEVPLDILERQRGAIPFAGY